MVDLGRARQKALGIKRFVRLPEGLHSATRRIGFDIVRYPATTLQDQCRNRILTRQRIDHVFDIGANIGQYASCIRRAGFSGMITSVEPQQDAFERLAAKMSVDPKWKGILAAVGPAEAEAMLNVASNSTSSSLFAMTDRHLEAAPKSAYEGAVPVQVRRLQRVIDKHADTEQLLGIKLDTQGGEIAMIQSLDEATLSRIRFLEAEVAIERCYDGDVLLFDALPMLEGLGYSIVGLWPAFADHEITGHLLQVDVLCVRTG